MSCPTCLVGFAGFGDAPSRVYAPVRSDIPLAGPLGEGPGPAAVRTLAAFGVGAVLGYVILRALLPSVAGAR